MISEYAIPESEFDNHVTQALELASSGKEERTATVYQFPDLIPPPRDDVYEEDIATNDVEVEAREEMDSALRMRDIAVLGAAGLLMSTTRDWIPAAGHLFETMFNR